MAKEKADLPLKKIDVPSQVFETLLERINSGVWKPGDKLPSENQLTEALGVSRISVREALQKLQGLNLVETMRGKGTYVKEYSSADYFKLVAPMVTLTKQEILYLLEYRQIIELGAVGLAIERAKPGDAEVLKGFTRLMGENLDDFVSYAYYDTQFHLKLSQMTGNPTIANAHEAIAQLLERAIRQTLSPEGAADGVVFHTQIIHAIERRDKPAGIAIMKQLLEEIVIEEENKPPFAFAQDEEQGADGQETEKDNTGEAG